MKRQPSFASAGNEKQPLNTRKIMNNPNAETARFVPRCTRRVLLALLLGIAVVSMVWWAGRADENHHATRVRWDIIHISSFSPLTVNAGGQASAKANNGAWITLTGTGTFLVNHGHGRPHAVTGGGTWEAFDEHGVSTASGTYKVTGLVQWEEAPGSPVAGTIDKIGDGTLTDNRGGLVVLSVRYSDKSKGSLVVSCHLPGVGPPETPETVFEGVTATKGFVGYWNRVAPVPAVDGNRTLFHALPHGDDDDDD